MRKLILLLGVASTPLAAQQRDPLAVNVGELEAHLRVISADSFEGRYPGTRGEARTTAYIISQLQAQGIKPGVHGAWLQPVTIVTHEGVAEATPEARLSGNVTRTLEHGPDLRLANYTNREEIVSGGDLIFVGYGIHAPVYGWDDLAGVDLKGKVVVALFGEPILPGDTVRFNGVRASRFAAVTDKLPELERRGAVGVLWIRPGRGLARTPPSGVRRLKDEAARASLVFSGNVADSLIATLLPAGSPPLAEVLASAARPGFRPIPLNSRLDVRFRTRVKEVVTHNVVGVVPGTDRARAAEHVVLSSHWDAFGIGPAVGGDSIYNGALDDGSGVMTMLALARVFGRNPQPRSITFLFTTAEEWGLVGARAFVRDGPLPTDKIVANLNMDDGIELFGVKRDAAPLGAELSTLGRTAADVAKQMGLRMMPDPYPEEGFFLRADNFPFAHAGVPALYMALGTDAEGQPAGFVDGKIKEYLEKHYHRPSDDYETVVIDLRGAVQYAHFVRDVTIAVARVKGRPEWLKGAEFQR